ncbi:disease resistance protein Pik-2-like [Oryza sativa Japonica Group]|nr:disease resistance protein Pik-2-like [Oryza sativa Japonica Group]XP_025876942.1 disease resistance protein Pik-2-like [Oryza sativa Japonica Group]
MDLVVGASSEAVKSLTGKLGSLLAQEYTLIAGVRDDIQYINDELASMQAFLSKLKRRDVDHDEQRQDWMKQVREVAYDIKDCVDDVGHRLGREPRGSGAAISFQRAWYLLTTLYKRRRIAAEIGNLKLRAQHVSERRTRYGVENLQGNGGGGGSGSGLGVGANAPRDRLAPLPRLIGTMEPVGMDAAIDELQEWFSKGKDGTQQRYLAIVGFGGLGKTTLAMALYRKLGDEFDCRAFVLASQKFHLPTVLRSLVKQFHEKQADASEDTLHGIEGWGDEMLKKKLLEQLTGKRYHILVDDIWSVSAWENIRDSFPKSDKGSCVVVTTRFNSVAEACRRQQGHVHKLKQLDPESSYNLFLQIISANDLCPIRPINARIIMKTCGGLPLAIVVVAGLIASKMKSKIDLTLDQHLVDVDEALSAELGSNLTTEGVTQIINHCYKNLPPDLKTCLLYLSTFPKGRSISRKHLIRRWIAEGFITEEHGKTAEEVAEDSLNELIGRNLIKPIKNSSNGRVKSCQIHDMVLQYIVSKSSDENFIAVIGGHWQTPLPSYKVRRLSVHKSDKQETDMVERMKLSHVRSLTVLESFSALHSTMLKFQILQVLDLDGCKDLSHPHQLKKICNMYQLKYLGLRRTDIDKIPKNIGRLEYLEVLDIRETNVRKLPTSFAKLQRMTHLLAGNKSKRTALKLTEEITKVVALQTLSGIEISGSSTLEEDREQPRDMPIRHSTTTRAEERGNTALHGPHKEASKVDLPKQLRPLEALEKLTNLKKLAIYKLVKFQAKDDELLLSAIEHLSSCSLKFLAIDDSFTGFLESSLSSSQAAPEHLYTLELSGMLSKAPGWIDRLHNLEKLTLSLTSLKTDTLVVLSSLPELFSLTFSLHAADNDSNALKIIHRNTMKSGGKIFVLDEGFEKLKLLHFAAPVLPSLSFLEGAMPELQRLELRFRMVDYMYGLENLSKLQQVFLTVSSQAPEDTRAKTSHIKQLASMIQKAKNSPNPSVVIDEYNELAKE